MSETTVTENDKGMTNEQDGGENLLSARKPLWPWLTAAFGVLIAVALIGYCIMARYFTTHYLPHTTVGYVLCEYMTADELVEQLSAPIGQYELQIRGRDPKTGESGIVLGVLAAEEINFRDRNSFREAEVILQKQKPWLWPAAYLGRTIECSVVFEPLWEEELVIETTKDWEAFREEYMSDPEDAYISAYQEGKNCYEIIPETKGSRLNTDKAWLEIEKAMLAGESAIDLEQLGCYIGAAICSNNKQLLDCIGEANTWLGSRIATDWYGTVEILDAGLLKDWVSIENGRPRLDEAAIGAYVAERAKQYDTYGKKKQFTTTLGVTLSLPGKRYGWKTDVEAETQELIRLIRMGSNIQRTPTAGIEARSRGENDIGDSYVEADLSNQHLYLYVDGEVVLETDFVSGTLNATPDCVTPAGVFSVNYKKQGAVLRGADYATKVNYWMPFYGNYGLHDASWRREFGGTIFHQNGSHGCINLPKASAKEIFEVVDKGFPVICYYYDENPTEQAVPNASEASCDFGGEGSAGEAAEEPMQAAM